MSRERQSTKEAKDAHANAGRKKITVICPVDATRATASACHRQNRPSVETKQSPSYSASQTPTTNKTGRGIERQWVSVSTCLARPRHRQRLTKQNRKSHLARPTFCKTRKKLMASIHLFYDIATIAQESQCSHWPIKKVLREEKPQNENESKRTRRSKCSRSLHSASRQRQQKTSAASACRVLNTANIGPLVQRARLRVGKTKGKTSHQYSQTNSTFVKEKPI